MRSSSDNCDGDVRLLAAVERSGTQSVGEFSSRVQRLIATALNVSATSLTSADKMDLMKQLHTRRLRPPVDGSAASELDTMVSQVLNVLPHVPANVIRQDLSMHVTLSPVVACLNLSMLMSEIMDVTVSCASVGTGPRWQFSVSK